MRRTDLPSGLATCCFLDCGSDALSSGACRLRGFTTRRSLRWCDGFVVLSLRHQRSFQLVRVVAIPSVESFKLRRSISVLEIPNAMDNGHVGVFGMSETLIPTKAPVTIVLLSTTAHIADQRIGHRKSLSQSRLRRVAKAESCL